jgi:hypothetical protein
MLLVKTELGQQAFKERSPIFNARQRSAYILFDGIKTVDRVLLATSGIGVSQADIDHLVSQNLLARVAVSASSTVKAMQTPERVTASADVVTTATTTRDRYLLAKPLATRLAASLGLRGFMLNLAVESASGFEELLALLPKLQDALGDKACREFEIALKS